MWLLYMRETFLVQCIEHAVIRRLYSRIRDAYLLHPLGIQSFVTFTIGTFQYRVQPNADLLSQREPMAHHGFPETRRLKSIPIPTLARINDIISLTKQCAR